MGGVYPGAPELEVIVDRGDLAERYKRAVVRESAKAQLNARCAKIIPYRDKYEKVSAVTGVPWFVVACIHNQEMGSDLGVFRAVLHNGEKIVGTPLKTMLVPKGRGPFATWEAAAIDALKEFGKHEPSDWTLSYCLDRLERYNGLGYRNRNIPSPYIWAMTDQYSKGHYTADGKFDANAVSKNTGCVAMMKTLGIFV
jgi:lysozyme family protein